MRRIPQLPSLIVIDRAHLVLTPQIREQVHVVKGKRVGTEVDADVGRGGRPDHAVVALELGAGA